MDGARPGSYCGRELGQGAFLLRSWTWATLLKKLVNQNPMLTLVAVLAVLALCTAPRRLAADPPKQDSLKSILFQLSTLRNSKNKYKFIVKDEYVPII
jgi:hypothetical protein